MDWSGWALFGLLATTGLTAVMIAAQLGGLSRLDLPLILGTLVKRGRNAHDPAKPSSVYHLDASRPIIPAGTRLLHS